MMGRSIYPMGVKAIRMMIAVNMASSTMLRMDALRVARAPWLLELRIFNYLLLPFPFCAWDTALIVISCAQSPCVSCCPRCGVQPERAAAQPFLHYRRVFRACKGFFAGKERFTVVWKFVILGCNQTETGEHAHAEGKNSGIGGHGRHRGL